MNDTTNTTPADDVLAKARRTLKAIAEYEEVALANIPTLTNSQYFARHEADEKKASEATKLVVLAPKIIAALETALARNRALEAQNAALKAAGREMLRYVDSRRMMLDIAQDERDYVARAGATMATWHALFADDGDGA